jgi:hypothetical protein
MSSSMVRSDTSKSSASISLFTQSSSKMQSSMVRSDVGRRACGHAPGGGAQRRAEVEPRVTLDISGFGNE